MIACFRKTKVGGDCRPWPLAHKSDGHCSKTETGFIAEHYALPVGWQTQWSATAPFQMTCRCRVKRCYQRNPDSNNQCGTEPLQYHIVLLNGIVVVARHYMMANKYIFVGHHIYVTRAIRSCLLFVHDYRIHDILLQLLPASFYCDEDHRILRDWTGQELIFDLLWHILNQILV